MPHTGIIYYERTMNVRNLLVVLVENGFHDSPESFLPFENSFLCDHVRYDIAHQTPLEIMMREIMNVILRKHRRLWRKGRTWRSKLRVKVD